MNWKATERAGWKHWVTPKAAKKDAVHRWYLFPHSFTGDLVHALIQEWGLTAKDRVLDPFVGSGTTLVAAKESGIPCNGFDLSPLAVLASNTKVATFSRRRLDAAWRALGQTLRKVGTAPMWHAYPELVRRALPDGRLEALDAIERAIEKTDCTRAERDFFRLALISVIPRVSDAVASGGWLRWLNRGARPADIVPLFERQVELMLSDVSPNRLHGEGEWRAEVADARNLPAQDGAYTAVVTSPPYPNRHDYTRVFGVELMFAFLDYEANRRLRYQSFHSHPEARPSRPSRGSYKPPGALAQCLPHVKDKRMRRMLEGYFLDMYLCLSEMARVTRKGARVALVVGNAQYSGQPIVVDEFTAELGEQAGLRCREIRAVRWRGNSAQQMGRYGRTPARESVVLFEKPSDRPA